MFSRIALTVVLLVALGVPALAEEVIIDGGGRFETLLGLRVGQRGIVFEIVGQGGGCTGKKQFHVERFGNDPVRLILIRDGHFPGECRGGIRIVRQGIAFSFSELGLELDDQLVVINPIEVNNIVVARKR